MLDLRSVNLESLNSATKYPSILTFHERGPKQGTLVEEATVFEGNVLLTEKVDGAGTRIVVFSNGEYVICSREELLYARGDLIANPKDGVVEALRPVADALWTPGGGGTQVLVLYLEVYGGKIGRNSGQYTGQDQVGVRLFDAAMVPGDVLSRTPAEASSWREHGGQTFFTEEELQAVSARQGIALTPRLGTIPASQVPTGIEEMHAFLVSRLPATRVALDAEAGHRPEGIVLRAEDRTVIAKARLKDYENTLRRRSGL
ncbi:RNA ligase family protein [Streptomyces graminilatus]|uniref:RNA ligase family protein n=1 Tax=Streptomyces graminilatus TaxID=1464070 RepID=UPI0006E2871F|nr:RNA ligase family protein [Streptomyces graminilatus]